MDLWFQLTFVVDVVADVVDGSGSITGPDDFLEEAINGGSSRGNVQFPNFFLALVAITIAIPIPMSIDSILLDKGGDEIIQLKRLLRTRSIDEYQFGSEYLDEPGLQSKGMTIETFDAEELHEFWKGEGLVYGYA